MNGRVDVNVNVNVNVQIDVHVNVHVIAHCRWCKKLQVSSERVGEELVMSRAGRRVWEHMVSKTQAHMWSVFEAKMLYIDELNVRRWCGVRGARGMRRCMRRCAGEGAGAGVGAGVPVVGWVQRAKGDGW